MIDDPAGICGPIGSTEQLPLMATIVNALDLKLHLAHFWDLDEWVEDGQPVPADHPLSFAKADLFQLEHRLVEKCLIASPCG